MWSWWLWSEFKPEARPAQWVERKALNHVVEGLRPTVGAFARSIEEWDNGVGAPNGMVVRGIAHVAA